MPVVEGTPNLEGLEVFEVEVDGDAERWRRLPHAWCPGDIVREDFPVRPGKRLVKYAVFPGNFFPENFSATAAMKAVLGRNLGKPDWPTVACIEGKHPPSTDSPIMGFCGGVRKVRNANIVGIVSVCGSRGAPGCNVRDETLPFSKAYRFMGVISETPIE